MKKYLLTITALLLCAVTIYAQPNTWTRKADFGGGARAQTARFSIDGKAYVGMGNNGTSYFKDFWEYNPATNKWTQKADFPGHAMDNTISFSIGNKGYVGGGADNYYGPYYKDFWEYDPATDKWTRKADLPGIARHFATGFSIGSKGYYGTGKTESPYVFYKDFWEYDPATDKWTRKADYGGNPIDNSASFAIGNKGYIGCGYVSGRAWVKDFWEYNPATDKWTRKADFGGVGREYVNSVGFSIGNKGYLGTGYAFAVYKDFWEYDPATDEWTRKADFGGSARAWAVGFSIGSKGYIGTGGDANGATKDLWEYTPEETTCNPPTNLKVTSTTDSSAKLGWTLPDASLKGFCIVYRPINTSVWSERTRKPTDDRIVLKGLSSNTTYQWKMRSICKDGYSKWVAGPDFTTASSFASTTEFSDALMAGKFGVYISPNPVTNNLLNLRITSANATTVNVSIIDMRGKTFITQDLLLNSAALNKAIDVSALPKGVYILKVINNKNEQQQIKFVKAN